MMLAEDEDDNLSHSLTGAARWAAPELTLITDYADVRNLLSLQSDMYSFGSIMFHVSLELWLERLQPTQLQILSGLIPYHGLSNNQVIGAIVRGERPLRPDNLLISD
jgi:serine/threonine protein kinase